ncbi:uncharacterized protein LOC127286875 [Leptopilina boulardi]|uniref:uncharacterized protein LOC127286875 n=1 Tax=Leptopilina boulardi TaxID=63433 RepID=UPI0021F66FDD|nr:uncharacterized protein LOC127286875 [Leptopilina boulardi]
MDYSIKSQEFNTNSPDGTDYRKVVKNILSQKIFIGEYVARRYVEHLQEYRDIVICRDSETEVTRFVQQIQKQIIAEYGDKKWLGITKNTETPDLSGYAFWCTLEKLPFGKHWFQVRSLKIKDKEVFLQLKYLRPFQSDEQKKDIVEDFITPNFKEICTFENLCEASKFSMVLFLTITTCLLKGGAFLLDFLVKVIHELSFLVQSFTPIALALINTIAKCIGGFYWLIYMLWKGESSPVPINRNQLALMSPSMPVNREHMINNSMSNSYYRPNRKSWDSRRSSGNRW